MKALNIEQKKQKYIMMVYEEVKNRWTITVIN